MKRDSKASEIKFPEFQAALLELQGDMTIEEFANKIGLSRATTGFYVSGSRLPDALRLRQIAEACNVSVDWLLGLSEFKNYGLRGITSENLHLSEQATKVQFDFWSDHYSNHTKEEYAEAAKNGAVWPYYNDIRNNFLGTKKYYFDILRSIATYVRKIIVLKQVEKINEFPFTPFGHRQEIASEDEKLRMLDAHTPMSRSYDAFRLQKSIMDCIDDMANKIADDILNEK